MWLRPVKSLYRRCVATIGAYALQRMLADGLPAFLHSPLTFLLTQNLQREDQLVVEKIETLRTRMAERRDQYVAVYASPKPVETSNP